MCEEKQKMELAKLGGSFWDGGVEAVEKGVKDMSPEDEEREEQEWVREVTETLESLKGVVVSEGYVRPHPTSILDYNFLTYSFFFYSPPADHAFHFSQLYIILSRTSQLLEAFASGLSDGSYGRDTVEYVLFRSTSCKNPT